MPSRASIIAGAGLSNPSILTPSPSLTITTEGAVVENLDVTGSILIQASNVTLRNVKVTGASTAALIRPGAGVTGTVIEHCEINLQGAAGGIGHIGSGTIVRNCRINGYGDGIKVESGGLYENNYITTSRAPGSTKHIDGMQGSGDSGYTIRHNVIDVPSSTGGNSAIFVQAWNGSANYNISNITVTENYLSGGNYTIFMNGGKTSDGTDRAKWVHNMTMTNNVFTPGTENYGLTRVINCAQTNTTGNITNTGTPVTSCS